MRSVALLLVLAGCARAEPAAIDQPPGFPAMPFPEENPPTAAKVELGRHLFYDVRLSGNGTQACASCHEQARAFSDGRVTPVGSTGEPHRRNSQALVNVGYNASLTWANPLLVQLEQQIRIPLFGEDPIELGASPRADAILETLAADPTYRALFDDAFPDRAPDWDAVVFGLATFTRALVSGNSPFDRFTYQGDTAALSEPARRGLLLFFSEELECHHCHGGFNFTESTVHADFPFDADLFHNTGLYDVDGAGAYPPHDTGLHELTGDPADMGRFRPPSLRNVALTAPYMHDGSIATLDEVIDVYAAGGRVIADGPNAGDGRANPHKSGFVAGFELSPEDRAALVAFLEALTDEGFVSDPRFADPWEE